MSNRTPHQRIPVPHLRRLAAALVASALVLVAAGPLGMPAGTALAASGSVAVDVVTPAPTVGATVTLVARALDRNGGPDTQGTTHVRFFFIAGSANDPGSPGNSAHLSCHTGTDGECSVSYVAAAPGTDTICAIGGGPTSQCSDAGSATVTVTIAGEASPDPGADPAASPEPTPAATPEPTPAATPEPTPAPTPEPTPAATPEPTPAATPDATPAADPADHPTPPPYANNDNHPTPPPNAGSGSGSAPTSEPAATPPASGSTATGSGASEAPDGDSADTPDSGSPGAPDGGSTPEPAASPVAPSSANPASSASGSGGSSDEGQSAPAPATASTSGSGSGGQAAGNGSGQGAQGPADSGSDLGAGATAPPADTSEPELPPALLAGLPLPSITDGGGFWGGVVSGEVPWAPSTGAGSGPLTPGSGSAGGPSSLAEAVSGSAGGATDAVDPRLPAARGLQGSLSALVLAAVNQAANVVKPEAAATVASTFGFPIVLMLAVLLFLLVQWQLDRRDPKLRAAPETASDTLLDFESEDEL